MTASNIQEKTAKRSWFNFSSLSTMILIGLALSMFIFPDVKAAMIKGLMNIGLFQPDTDAHAELKTSPVENVVFSDISGKKTSLSELRGKVVFINFWATWCPPCRAEMPAINKLYSRFKANKNVVFLMADADGKLKTSAAYMKKKGFSLPVHKLESDVPESLFSGSLPTTVILDKVGNIVYSGTGAADYSNPKVEEFLNKLLK